MVFVSGQIGLYPPTMEFITQDPILQLWQVDSVSLEFNKMKICIRSKYSFTILLCFLFSVFLVFWSFTANPTRYVFVG